MSPREIELRHLDATSPADRATWDAFVAGQPDAAIAHAAGWAPVIRLVYGHRTHLLAACIEGEIAGVLPLTEVKSRLSGTSLTSIPYHDVAGMLASDLDVRAELMRGACALARARRIHQLDLRSLGRPAVRGPSAQNKVTLILPLGQDEETLWKAIGSKPRNQVRKAQKSGLTVTRVGAEGLGDFYRVYATNMRDLGSPPHKLAWFERIFEVFGDAAGCHLLAREGETIGGLIALDQHDTVTVPWASSDRRYFKLCPNNLLYWETFRAAIDRGRTRFDFGRSSRGAGTYKFKRQWGAEEVPLYWQQLDAARIAPASIPALVADAATAEAAASAGSGADTTQAGGMRAMAVGIWQRLPVGVATWLGTRVRGDITL